MSDQAGDSPIRRQAFRFAALSALSFVSYLGVTALLHEVLGLPSYAAVLIAMACVTVMNFCTLRVFVFESKAGDWRRQFAGFIASIAGFRAVEFGAFLLLHGVLGLPYLLAYGLILAVSMICKFLFLRGLIFHQTPACPEVTT